MLCPLAVALFLLKLASYAQELDEVVDVLLPLLVGQDLLEHASIQRMRLSKNAGGFDVTPMLVPPAWRNQLDHERWKLWDSSRQPGVCRQN